MKRISTVVLLAFLFATMLTEAQNANANVCTGTQKAGLLRRELVDGRGPQIRPPWVRGAK